MQGVNAARQGATSATEQASGLRSQPSGLLDVQEVMEKFVALGWCVGGSRVQPAVAAPDSKPPLSFG